MRGEAAIPRTLAMALVERHRMLARSGAGMRPTESPLSSGEREVLDLMATGALPREIATELAVPVETTMAMSSTSCASSESTRGRRRS